MNIKRQEVINAILKEKELTDNLLKQEAPKSLYIFNKFVLKAEEGENKVPLAKFHRELCNFAQERRDKKKLILVPRMHLKSTLITVGYSIFRIIDNPNIRILIISGTHENAEIIKILMLGLSIILKI